MGVIVGVAHDLVSGVVKGLNRLRVFVDPFAHNEEGSVYVVFCEYVDKLLRVFVAPGRVEGQCHGLIVSLDAVNGKLPLACRCSDDCGAVGRPEYHCQQQYKGQRRNYRFAVFDFIKKFFQFISLPKGFVHPMSVRQGKC